MKNGVRIDPVYVGHPLPPKGGEGRRVSLVKCTESISNIMKPNISAANIETDIHAHAFASAGAKSGEHRAPLEFPSSFPIQKRLDRITSAARNPFILRPSDASPIRDGGGGRGREDLCTRVVSRPRTFPRRGGSGSGSGDFGFRLTQTPTLQLMPGHVDLFH